MGQWYARLTPSPTLLATMTNSSSSQPQVPGFSDLHEIGRGGFAVVYRATQDSVGRDVALKVMNQAGIDADTLHRFQRECRTVGQLSWHPHIAKILDAGVTADDKAYLAFELLAEGSLADRLSAGPQPWTAAVAHMIQVTDALAAAHDEGVLHRDLKPANILIDRLGQARLADFGVAMVHDGNQTATGVITATISHAAPELLGGERATEASDVYGLGSCLYNLLAGSPPFGVARGEDLMAVVARIAHDPPPSLLPHGVPPAVAEVVERALQKKADDRWPSARAMGQALQTAQQQLGCDLTPMPYSAMLGHAVSPAAPDAPTVADTPTTMTAPHTTEAPDPLSLVATEQQVEQHAAPLRRADDPTPAFASAPGTGSAPKSRLPLVALGLFLLLAAGIGVAVWQLASGDDDVATGPIVPSAVFDTSAESSAPVGGITFGASNLFDGDLGTAWRVDGDAGAAAGGEGFEIVIRFETNVTLTRVGMVPGWAALAGDRDLLRENRRVLEAEYELAGGVVVTQRFLDAVDRRGDDGTTVALQELELDEPATTSFVIIRITETTELDDASVGDATAVSEVVFTGSPATPEADLAAARGSLSASEPTPRPTEAPGATSTPTAEPDATPTAEPTTPPSNCDVPAVPPLRAGDSYEVFAIQADDPDGGLVIHTLPGADTPVAGPPLVNGTEVTPTGACEPRDGFDFWEVDVPSRAGLTEPVWIASRWLRPTT